MLKVRQTLTEILLEVTNEEIFMIAKETLSRFQAKGIVYNIKLDVLIS